MYDAIAASLRLRYRLLPYLYSLAGWTTHRGYTPMRALAFDFRHDPRVFDIVDQFMLGPALLVCPVTHAMHHGPGSTPLDGAQQSRSVYLPAGCGWYDFWTGEHHEGGQTMSVDAPLERIPVFVREDSILPLGPEVQHSGESVAGPLELRVYAGSDGALDLYDDAGDGYGYEDGELSATPLRWDDAERVLSVGGREGSFPGMAPTRRLHPVAVGGGVGTGAAVLSRADPLIHRGEPLTWSAD